MILFLQSEKNLQSKRTRSDQEEIDNLKGW